MMDPPGDAHCAYKENGCCRVKRHTDLRIGTDTGRCGNRYDRNAIRAAERAESLTGSRKEQEIC